MQAAVVPRSLHNDFVRPDTVHQIVQRFGSSCQCAFYTQARSVIWHHSYRPPRLVRRRSTIADAEDLSRRCSLIALAEWAEARVLREFLEMKVRWLQSIAILHDCPAVRENVLPHLGHLNLRVRRRN